MTIDNMMAQIGLSNVGNALANVFRDIELAEERIATAISKHPDRADMLNAAFLLLQRPSYLRLDNVYIAHMDEILERIANSDPISPPTDGEMLAILVETSLATPLSAEATNMYAVIYNRVQERSFPDLPRQEVIRYSDGQIMGEATMKLEIARQAQKMAKSDDTYARRKAWDKATDDDRISGKWWA